MAGEQTEAADRLSLLQNWETNSAGPGPSGEKQAEFGFTSFLFEFPVSPLMEQQLHSDSCTDFTGSGYERDTGDRYDEKNGLNTSESHRQLMSIKVTCEIILL